MKGNKIHRHQQNPLEKQLHDLFVERFGTQEQISSIVLPVDENGRYIGTVSEDEMKMVISAIQWVGSPVGLSFLRDCGFKY